VGIVTAWWLDSMWHPQIVYPSTIFKLHEWCIDEDNARIGPGWLVFATKWNVLHPIQED